MQFSSIWPIDRSLPGATTPDLSGTRTEGNEGVLRIPQSSSITLATPSDCFVLYPEHSLGSVIPLQRYSQCILQPKPIQLNEYCVDMAIQQFDDNEKGPKRDD